MVNHEFPHYIFRHTWTNPTVSVTHLEIFVLDPHGREILQLSTISQGRPGMATNTYMFGGSTNIQECFTITLRISHAHFKP